MATINTNATAVWATQATNGGLAQVYGNLNAAGAQYNALASNAEHNQAAIAHAAQVGYTSSSVSFGSGTPLLPVVISGSAPDDLITGGSAPAQVFDSTPTLSWGSTGPSLSGDLTLAPGLLQAPSAAALPGAVVQPASPPAVALGQVWVGPASGQEGPSLQAPTAISATAAMAQLIGVQTYGAETSDSGIALITSGQVVGLGGIGG